jgi:hypothetical protein
MNIQKYIGPDGQPSHICFSFHILAHNKTNWASRLEKAIVRSDIRRVADVEIIKGRIVADRNMIVAYLFFPKQDQNLLTAVFHSISFANVLGVHDFAASGSPCDLNFINS